MAAEDDDPPPLLSQGTFEYPHGGSGVKVAVKAEDEFWREAARLCRSLRHLVDQLIGKETSSDQ